MSAYKHAQDAASEMFPVADPEGDFIQSRSAIIARHYAPVVGERDSLRAELEQAQKACVAKDEALREIESGTGPFKRDPLEFASTVIDKAKRLSSEAVALTPASLAGKVLVDAEALEILTLFVTDKTSDPKNDGTYTLSLDEKEYRQLFALLDAATATPSMPSSPPSSSEPTRSQ